VKAALFDTLSRRQANDQPVVIATLIAATGTTGKDLGRQLLIDPGGPDQGGLGAAALDDAARQAAATALETFTSKRLSLRHQGETVELFIDVCPPRRTLILVGAVHVAISLAAMARTLGMRTAVVDPRTAFATDTRFPHVDLLSHAWPDRALEAIGLGPGSYVATLSHDDKLDVPALAAALKSPARYIGALGSRKTHAKRQRALRAMGFDEQTVARIHNPIGLPLGGRRAEEIAVAILAEIVAADHGAHLIKAAGA